jgi:hypothetical protein
VEWDIAVRLKNETAIAYSLSYSLGNVTIPVAARSKAKVCGQALAGIVGSSPTGGMDICLVQCLCCQVEVSATGRSLIQRSPTECGVCLSVIK